MHGSVSLCNQLPNSEPGLELTAVSLACSGLRYGRDCIWKKIKKKVLTCLFSALSSPSTLAHLKTFD